MSLRNLLLFTFSGLFLSHLSWVLALDIGSDAPPTFIFC